MLASNLEWKLNSQLHGIDEQLLKIPLLTPPSIFRAVWVIERNYLDSLTFCLTVRVWKIFASFSFDISDKALRKSSFHL